MHIILISDDLLEPFQSHQSNREPMATTMAKSPHPHPIVLQDPITSQLHVYSTYPNCLAAPSRVLHTLGTSSIFSTRYFLGLQSGV